MKLLRFPENEKEIRNVLDHAELASLLVPFTTEAQVKEACETAVKYGMAGVLAIPDICQQTVKFLAGTKVRPIAVIDAMELGDNAAAGRLFSVKELVKLGVKGVDSGIPTNIILDGEYDEIAAEIRDQAAACHEAGAEYGVTLNIDSITPDQLAKVCECAISGGADYLRTSCGMEQIGADGIGRATVHNIAELSELYGDRIKIKAGGGWDFAWLEDSLEYLLSGASRVDVGPVTVGQLERIGYGRG